MKSDPSEIIGSRQMLDGVHGIIQLALVSVHADGEPFLPFATFQADGEGILGTYIGDSPDASRRMAYQDIAARATSPYALAWDGYLTMDGIRYEAIYVEASEPGLECGYGFAQRYRRPPTGGKPERIGKPMYLGRRESAFVRSRDGSEESSTESQS